MKQRLAYYRIQLIYAVFDVSKREHLSNHTFVILQTMTFTDKSPVSEAAAALVKALELHVACTGQNQKLAAILEALEISFDSNGGFHQVIQHTRNKPGRQDQRPQPKCGQHPQPEREPQRERE
jgi:hypothetical protein